jgi:hypothetical protein
VVNEHSESAITAWLALGFSLLSLAWNVAELFIRWPRIGVVMRQSLGIGTAETDSTQDVLHVFAVNNGAEAASIADIAVRTQDRSVDIRVTDLRDKGKAVEGPELPARVEAHGALEWNVPYNLLDPIPEGTTMIGYVKQYQKVRRWPWPKSQRSPLRFIESSNTRVKT